jgi:hypothetical protein
MKRIQTWLQRIAGKQDTPQPQQVAHAPVKPNAAARILDVWLEQVGSLKQLRMHDLGIDDGVQTVRMPIRIVPTAFLHFIHHR